MSRNYSVLSQFRLNQLRYYYDILSRRDKKALFTYLDRENFSEKTDKPLGAYNSPRQAQAGDVRIHVRNFRPKKKIRFVSF